MERLTPCISNTKQGARKNPLQIEHKDAITALRCVKISRNLREVHALNFLMQNLTASYAGAPDESI
jgi:hypothetical protein